MTMVYILGISAYYHDSAACLLGDGRIVAAGEHRELVADSELYRHLYYLEFNPFAEAAG